MLGTGHHHGMLKGFQKPLMQMNFPKPQVNPRTLGFAPYFSGDDIGQYYTSLGRGGKVILDPINPQEPAVDYVPIVAVNAPVYGRYITGNFAGMPLAQIVNPNATQPVTSI